MSETESDQDAHSLEGQVVAERYAVLELLGEGAMGRVYRARHVHMQKLVALKVLHRRTSESPEVVSRFEREAIVAGKLDHPNVASATDFGRLRDGSFYLVLEFVEGESLGALLKEGALPVARAIDVAIQIARALAAAHRAGIVHRDLKPENVMLVQTPLGSSPGGPGPESDPVEAAAPLRVKVLDFGLAKLQESDATETKLTMVGAVYGTPQYMSPEQAEGQAVDHRADLYALGLILYEMLAGRPPFESEQIMPLLIKHMTEEPPALPAGVPRDLRAIVFRLLEKSPASRFSSGDEVIEALELVAAGGRAPQRSVVSVNLPSREQVQSSALRLSAKLTETIKTLAPLVSGDVTLRGRRLPRAALTAGAGALVFGFVLVVLSSGGGEETPRETGAPPAEAEETEDAAEVGARAEAEELPPELKKLIAAARDGSDAALSALELRKDSERGVSELLALSHGRLLRKKVGPALEAFGRAIELDPSAREDRALVGMLRYLADEDERAERILPFVAEHLGERAPDFLFDVWSGTSLKTKATTLAWDLLDEWSMRSRYSDALKVALDLRSRKTCGDRIPLLGRVEEIGDERCMLLLRDMKKDRDCEKKAGKALDQALLQAGQRKAPKFPLLRRIRFKQ